MSRQTEVNNHQAIEIVGVLEHDVIRFEVSVDDSRLVDEIYTLEYLSHYLTDLLRSKSLVLEFEVIVFRL